ncbi:MAG: response regulator [Elusimicrobiales bacterium]|nr:response regulator [Elusimicrobiales bacterium]
MANILIIEDDGIVRDALRELLTRAGHKVQAACDGGNGVAAFKNQRPDLVILDRNLPVLSGSGVFANIRAFDPAARIILLSGYDEPEEVAVYLNHGAAAFLSKEDGLSNVLMAVESVVGTCRPRAETAAQALPLVLVADDEKMVRDILARALGEIGCRVIQAVDGEQAAELAREQRPDIVMLDVVMPKKDGLQVLRELLPELPAAAFMLITGYGEEKNGREALRLGALDYIAKPFNIELVKTAVEARLLQQDKLGAVGL